MFKFFKKNNNTKNKGVDKRNDSLNQGGNDTFLDRKIIAIQQSTKTNIPFFAKTNEWLRQHSKWYYKMRINPLYRFDSLDDQLVAIQKSTKTTFRVFAPLHDWLRLHSVRYYFWSINSYSNYVHYGILATYTTVLIIFSVGILNQGLYNPIKANIDFVPGITEKTVDYSKIYASVPKDAKEITEKRTANSKAFRLNNGSIQYIISSGILHYKVGDKWYNMDSLIEPNPDGSGFIMDKSIYIAKFDKNFTANPLMTAKKDDQTLTVKPGELSWSNNTETELISSPKDVVATSAGHDVTYKDAYGPGLDFGYETEDLQLNKKLTIPTLGSLPISTLNPDQNNELYLKLKLAFSTDQHLDIYIDGNIWDGSEVTLDHSNIVFKKGDQVVWQLTPAKAWGSSVIPAQAGIQDSGHSGIIGKTTISRSDNTINTSISFPYSWLKEAQYPITIDPATVYANADDGYIEGGNSVYATAHTTSSLSDDTATTFNVGQSLVSILYTVDRGFLRFDTSGLDDTATVSQANLHLTATGDSSATDFDIDIFKTDWTSTLSANRAANYTAALGATKDVTLTNTNGMSLNTDMASPNLDTTRIIRNGYSYFILKSSRDTSSSTPTGLEYVQLASEDNATASYHPYLSVIVTTNDYTWDAGGDGVSWSDANNWDKNSGYPSTVADKAIINTGSAAIATPAGALTVGEINIGASYSGTVTLGNNLTITNTGGATGALTIANASAVLNINGKTVSIASTVSNIGTIKMTGDETVTLTTGNDTDSGTIEYSATSGSRDIKSWTYYSLKINGSGGTFKLPASTTVNGNLDVTVGTLNTKSTAAVDKNLAVTGTATISTSGILVANSSTITLSGNWDSTLGTFTDGTSTLDFTGAGSMSFKNGVNIYNLKAGYTGNSNTLVGNTLWIQNVLTLAGDATGKITTSTTGWFGFKSSDKLSGQIVSSGAILESVQTYFFNYSNTDVVILPALSVYYQVNLSSQVTTGHYKLGGNVTVTSVIDIKGNSAGNMSILDLDGYTMQNGSAIYVGNGTNTKNGQIVNNSATTDASIIDTSTTYGLTIYAAATPGNNAVIANGAHTINITLAAHWSNADTYTAGAGTVTFNGTGTQTLNSGGVAAANTFNNLTHSGSGTLQLTTNAINVDGTFTNSAGTLNANSMNMTFAGAWNNTGSATFTRSAGTMTFDGTSTVTNSSSNAASLAAVAISGTVTLGSNLIMASNSGAGTLNLGAGSYSFTITGTGTPLAVTTFQKGTGSTVIYTGTTTATTIAAVAFNNLTLTPTGATAYSLAGHLNAGSSTAMTGDLTINANATLNTKPSATDYGIDCVNVTIATGGVLTANASAFTVSGNWTNNGGTFTAGSSAVTFNGTGAQAINGTAATQTFWNVIVAKTAGQLLNVSGSTTTLAVTGFTETTGNFTAPATFNISGALTLTAGTFTAGTNTNATYNWTNNGGTFVPGTNTVTFNNTLAGQAINGTATTQTFYNVIVAKSAQLLSVSGSTTTLAVTNFTETTGDFTAPATFNVAGNITLTAGTFTAGTDTNITGNWANNGGTFTPGTNTVTFNGAGQTINSGGTGAGKTFYNLTKSGSGTLQVVTSAISITATLTIGSSTTFDLNSQNFTLLTLANNGTLKLAGDETVAITTFDSTHGTAEYSATAGSRDIKNYIYNNLKINGSGGTFKLPANLTVNANLDVTLGTLNTQSTAAADKTLAVTGNITIGDTLVANTSAISLNGNWARTGTFTYNTSTVTFSGSVAETITGTDTFYNLTINNSYASPSDTYDVDPDSAQTVTNTLTISDGQYTPFNGDTYKDVVISAAGIMKPDNGATLNASGNWTNNGGSFSTVPASNVIFNGTGAQAINGTAASQTFYNLTVAKTAGQLLSVSGSTTTLATTISFAETTGNFTAPATFNIGTSLTLTAGTFTAGTTVTIGGDWTNNGGTFTPGTNTVNFSSNSTAINGTAATQTFYNLTVAKIAGQLLSVGGSTTSLAVTNFTETTGNFTAPATFDVAGTITLTAGTLTAGANINIGRNWTNNGGTFVPGTNTVTFDDSGDQSINGTVATQTFYNLVTAKIPGTLLSVGGNTTTLNVTNFTETTGDFTAPSTFNIAGNIALISGTCTAGANINLSGNWTNSGGTFTHNNSTVTFAGTNSVTISGSNTFHNLIMDASVDGAKTVNFSAGETNTTTIASTWTIKGASSKVLTLRSVDKGSAWYFNIPASFTSGSYISVEDSYSANSYKITAGDHVTNINNNLGWFFSTTSPTTTPPITPYTSTGAVTSSPISSDQIAGNKPNTPAGQVAALINALQNNEVAQNIADVAKKVVQATSALGLLPLAANIIGGAPPILHAINYVVSLILEALGIRRKRKNWGRIFDSTTGRGVDMALVRLYDQETMQLKDTIVTDSNGKYHFSVQPGVYAISVSKEEYIFPTEIFAKYGISRFNKSASRINSQYVGQPINIDSKNNLLNLDVPIDPVAPKISFALKAKILSGDILNFLIISLPYIFIPLLSLGSILSVFTAIVRPDTRNIVLSIIYVSLTVGYLISRAIRFSHSSIVLDVETKQPIAGVMVSLFEKEHNTLKESQITDHFGRFSIYAPKGHYYLKAQKSRYDFEGIFKEAKSIVLREPSFIRMNIEGVKKGK